MQPILDHMVRCCMCGQGVERSEEMLDLSKLMLQHIEPRRLVLHRDLPTLAEQVTGP